MSSDPSMKCLRCGKPVIKHSDCRTCPCDPDAVNCPHRSQMEKTGEALLLQLSNGWKEAKARYEELEHKGWDYRSFHNGWREGQAAFYRAMATLFDDYDLKVWTKALDKRKEARDAVS